MKIDEYMFLLACANFSFIAGFMVCVSKKNYLLLIGVSIGAALIFGAAYCQSAGLFSPLYRLAPALGGLFYAFLTVQTFRRVRRRPDKRNMAVMLLMVTLGHLGATGACFYLWPEG